MTRHSGTEDRRGSPRGPVLGAAAALAAEQVAAVRDDPGGRRELMSALYREPVGDSTGRLPFRRAALAFMDWQTRRGLLDPSTGSPWWRAVSEDLLRDTGEARALESGYGGSPSSMAVGFGVDFIRNPTAQTWYRAHNASVVSAYLRHTALAEDEGYLERFFVNLVLTRVLYAHALVAAPRLALGWCHRFSPALGDPRLGMTGIFLSLSRVLPGDYPLRGDLGTYTAAEHGIGRLLDLGMILPRLRELYDWSATKLELPEVRTLLVDDVPAYAWDPADADPWHQKPSLPVRAVWKSFPPR